MEQSEQVMARTPIPRLREALRVSEERLELILRGSKDGFWDWNVATDELYLGPRWLEMLGYAEGELEPHIRTLENVCHPDDLPSLREALRAQLEGSASQAMEIEHRVRTKSGDWKWFLTRGTGDRRDEHGKVSRMAGTATDITDRKHAEEELREHRDLLDEMVAQRTLELAEANAGLEFDIVRRKQAEKELQESNTMLTKALEREKGISTELKAAMEEAEAANQAKSEFLANMSHEIRTPLHGILSFARFGKDKVLTADPEKLLNYFEKIDMSGQRLLVLLTDILDLAKMEAGGLRYEFKHADFRFVLRSVINEFHSLLADRNITVDYAEPDSELRLTLDENRMAQVVRNLLSNAAKFSPEGGTVWIDVNEGDEGVRISIRDHGMGVPEDELETVFDKFVQSSKSRTGAGGTGLGLSICRQIVEAHQGRIWCENHPEGGALFHVVLPRTMQGGSPQERAEPRGVRKTEATQQAPAVGIS